MIRSLSALALLLPLTASAGYEASSTKKDARFGDNVFAVASALDSKLDTTWQCDPEKDNIGQWIELDVPVSEIDKLGVVIGWDKNEKTFKDYARLKSATVEVFSKGIGGAKTKIGESKVQFADQRGWQIVDLPDLKVEGELGGSVRLTVAEVYPGVDFPNLAIGEIRVHLKEFPAETLAFGTEPAAGDPKHGPELLLDNNPKTYFIAQGTSTSFTATARGYGLASVGLFPGPATHARPKTVVLKANDTEVEHTIAQDAKGPQWLLLPAIIGFTGGAWGEIGVEIKDSWPGSVATNPVALGELKVNAGTIEEF